MKAGLSKRDFKKKLYLLRLKMAKNTSRKKYNLVANGVRKHAPRGQFFFF
jgi:hypothetical protein